jgi:hypothetical protein
MENQKSTSKQIMLNHGLLLGVVSVLLSVTIYAMGKIYDQGVWVMLVSFTIMAVIIFLGLQKFRTSNNGLLSLGEALKIGLGISLIGAIVSIIYNQIFINVIEPDFMKNMLEVAEQKMLETNPNMSDDQIEMALSMSKTFSKPIIGIAMAIIGSLFFGFIISLIEGLILKRTDEDISSI